MIHKIAKMYVQSCLYDLQSQSMFGLKESQSAYEHILSQITDDLTVDEILELFDDYKYDCDDLLVIYAELDLV